MILRYGLGIERGVGYNTAHFGESIADLADKYLRADGGRYKIIPALSDDWAVIRHHYRGTHEYRVAFEVADKTAILEAYIKKCAEAHAYPIEIAPDGAVISIDGEPIAEYLEGIDEDGATALSYVDFVASQEADDDEFIAAQGWNI
jgi:hypothetical protein